MDAVDLPEMRRTIFLLCLFTLMSMGCAAPRIYILKDPLTSQEHMELGLSYKTTGDTELAIRHFLKSARGPLRSQSFFHLGNAYFENGDYPKAEAAYLKSIARAGGQADAHNNLAWLYFIQRKNLRRAEELAERAIRLNPAGRDVYEDTLEKIRDLRKHTESKR